MRAIISRECYKLCHSKKIWIAIFLLLMMTILMFFMSIGRKKEMIYVLFDETEEEREFFTSDGWMYQDIVDVIGKGYVEHNLGEPMLLYMKPEAFALFQEGGKLYEKYKDYHFPERMVLQQMVGEAFGSPDQEDLETTWKFHKMLTDFSAYSFTAFIFTALVFLILSLIELLLAGGVFIPKIELLSVSYFWKGLFLHCFQSLGIALLCVPFVFLTKSEWKAIGVAFFIMLLFMSNRAIINIDPYLFVSADYWKTCSEIGITVQVGIVTATIFIVSGFLSYELFQRAELK